MTNSTESLTQSADVDAVGTPFSTYEMTTPRRKPSEVAERAQLLAGVLLDQYVPPAAFSAVGDIAARSADATHPSGRVDTTIRAPGELTINYDEQIDELRVANQDVKNDPNSVTDVGPAAATSLFRATCQRLVKAGLVDGTVLNSDPIVSHMVRGGAWAGQPPAEELLEYLFFVPQKVGGIGLRNELRELGLNIAIHRSGQVASIQVSGVSDAPTLAPRGRIVRAVTRTDLDLRVSKEFPGATIRPEGLQYILHTLPGPDGFAPYQTYYVSPRYDFNGTTMNARGQYVSYPLGDLSEPIRYPLPHPDDPGDPR